MIAGAPPFVTPALLDIEEVTRVAQITHQDATTQDLCHRWTGHIHTEIAHTQELLIDPRMARGAEAEAHMAAVVVAEAVV